MHHLNLAHGLAVKAIREECGSEATVSTTLNLHVVRPADESRSSIEAAEQIKLLGNEVFLGPILEGKYPQGVIDLTAEEISWDFVQEGDLELINQPLDVLGVNYYNPSEVRMAPVGATPQRNDGHDTSGASPWPCADRVEFVALPGERTEMGWPIDVSGLKEILVELSERYPSLPLMITENGMADADPEKVGGAGVADPRRITYIRDHLNAVLEALNDGVDVRGYFVWSLLDNFEWSYGYTKRFGIVHVDYDSFERTPKESAYWYRDLVKSGDLS